MKTIHEILKLVHYDFKNEMHFKTIETGLCLISDVIKNEKQITKKEKDLFTDYIFDQNNHSIKLNPISHFIWDFKDTKARIEWLEKNIKKTKP